MSLIKPLLIGTNFRLKSISNYCSLSDCEISIRQHTQTQCRIKLSQSLLKITTRMFRVAVKLCSTILQRNVCKSTPKGPKNIHVGTPPTDKRGFSVNDLSMPKKQCFTSYCKTMVCTNLEENQPIIATPREIHFEIVSWNASMLQLVHTNCYNLIELFTIYGLVVNGKNEGIRPKMAACYSKCFDGLISSTNSTFYYAFLISACTRLAVIVRKRTNLLK